MPKNLTDAYFRNKKAAGKPYKITDGNGLYLLVQPNGSRLWRYRYRINGIENVFAVGDYEHMGLQQARLARDEARKLVREGVHPAQQRRAARLVASERAANTFEAVAREWMDLHRGDWTPYYYAQVTNSFDRHVFRRIGRFPITDVKAAHLLAILKDVAARPAPTIAVLIRQWCSAIFRYAAATLRIDHDPASALKGAIKKPKTKHKRPLAPEEIPLLRERIDAAKSTFEVKCALNLLLHTFVRPGELRQAEWLEFDLAKQLWRLPAERMKMREEHVVPLSSQAVGLLKELKANSTNSRFVFPNQRDGKRPMSATTLNRCLERLGYGGLFSAHGFRATASTLLNEMGFEPDWIERQLAHAERSSSRRSYNHALHLPERRKMLQEWSNYIDGLAVDSTVAPIFRKGRAA